MFAEEILVKLIQVQAHLFWFSVSLVSMGLELALSQHYPKDLLFVHE